MAWLSSYISNFFVNTIIHKRVCISHYFFLTFHYLIHLLLYDYVISRWYLSSLDGATCIDRYLFAHVDTQKVQKKVIAETDRTGAILQQKFSCVACACLKEFSQSL